MYVIIGASGFIGPYFLNNILEKTSANIIATYQSNKLETNNPRIFWHKLDVTNYTEVKNFCLNLRSDNSLLKIIYLSAISNPDYVEKNPEQSYKINVTSLEKFLDKLPENSAFYFASSDSVYGESIKNYSFIESDLPEPINEYGRQKAAAEKIVLSSNKNVLRFPLMIGKSMCNKKHLYDTIIEKLSSGNEIEMFSDSYRNCITFNQASKLTIDLIENYTNKNLGIINLCCDDNISRYELALLLAEKFSYQKKLIKPVESDFSNIFAAKRAKKTILDNTKLKNLLNLDRILIQLD